ncbi:tetratricopeptide repeat protein [bacterium]|nr:tetratricopeptide repeat protein [bacterium]
MKNPKTILILISISLLCSCATPEKKSPTINNLTKKEAHPAIKIPPVKKPKVKTIEKKVIAVMKFENLSKNPKFDWLCEGIASTLVSKLGNVKKVRLVERSQVRKSLQEINFNMSGVVDEKTAVSAGKILGAKIMVIGEFQKSADQMRITTRFVDVVTGKIINTAQATGSYTDIFSLQDEIAFNLLKTLGVKVKVAEQKKIQKKPTESLTAYEWVEKAINLYEKKYEGKENNISKEDQNIMIKYFKKAIRSDPDYADAHYNLGSVYIVKGLYDKAIEEFKETIRIKPDDTDVHNSLGVVYVEKGLWDEAMEEFKEAIKINPDYAEAHYMLGSVYIVKGLWDEAIEECKETLRINPDLAEAHYGLAWAYGEKGLDDKAMEEFKEAIKINPDFAEAHYNLGVVYGKKGLDDKAMEEFKEAIKINPDFAEAHYNLGVVYGKKDLYNEAIEEFKEVIKINPDYAEAHYMLGIAYCVLGRKSEALDEYRILKELDKEKANELFNLIYK